MSAREEIKGFVKQVALVLGAGLIVGGYPIYATWGREALTAAFMGCAISTANIVVGGVSIVWSFDKPQAVFLKVILGGMAARMMAIFVVLILLVKGTSLPIFPLLGSMFGFYLVYQVIELRFVVKRGQVQNGV